MKILKDDFESINLELSTDELLIIRQILKVACKQIDEFEFQTRMGVFKEDVMRMAEILSQVIDKKHTN